MLDLRDVRGLEEEALLLFLEVLGVGRVANSVVPLLCSVFDLLVPLVFLLVFPLSRFTPLLRSVRLTLVPLMARAINLRLCRSRNPSLVNFSPLYCTWVGVIHCLFSTCPPKSCSLQA